MDKLLIETKFNYDRKSPNAKHAAKRAQWVRNFIHEHTLAWGTDGIRLLPYALFESMKAALEDLPDDCEFDLEHYYIPYPAQEPEFAEELDRREFIAFADLKGRVRMSLELFINKVAADYSKSRFHKSSLECLPEDAVIYRAFNNIFNNEHLAGVIAGLEGLGRFEIADLRRNGTTRAKAALEAEALLTVLSNA